MVQKTEYKTEQKLLNRQKYPIQNSTKAVIWSRKQNTKQYRSRYIDRNTQYRAVQKLQYGQENRIQNSILQKMLHIDRNTQYRTVQKLQYGQENRIQNSIEDATYRQKYPIQNSTKAAIWSRKQNTKPYRSCYIDRNAQYRTVLKILYSQKNLYRIKTVK